MTALGTPLIDAAVHDAVAMRQAGPALLGLALMDARNRTLGWLAAFDGLPASGASDGAAPAWWLAGQAAWFQEFWIARFVQRGRGEAADASAPRLPSVDGRADAWFAPRPDDPPARWQAPEPDSATLRAYLSATLDTTLDLLARATPDDDGLLVFRLALQHEDLLGEALATRVQMQDLAPERHQALVDQGLWPALPGRARRDPLCLPGQTVQCGSLPGGLVPASERWAHPVPVPAFEIDAQPVSWAEYVEFVADGGYDDRRWWTEAGWALLQASGRRAPRYVEQTGGGVLARRHGRLQRLPLAQAVLHVNAHEAQAWCQWAGRRLPTEAEWLAAASSATAQGFVWGELCEWMAGSARAWPALGALADRLPALDQGLAHPAPGAGAAAAGGLRVAHGASAWGSRRLRHLQARRYLPAGADEQFIGFRSCAL